MRLFILLTLFFLINTAFANSYPLPVAAAFYPIYNSGTDQYIVPTSEMPFNKISTLFVAFGHTYPQGNGANFTFEDTQPDEINRLPLLVKTARQKNPEIKILISLGWGHNDWTYINTDYVNHADLFVPSVIQFIRTYDLDGFDIDDEGINGLSGSISQANFDVVIKNLRNALDKAGLEDHKQYYLTITPAGGTAEVNQNNMMSFDLINTQNYGGSYPDEFINLGYPAKSITQGINSEYACQIPIKYQNDIAGIFDWSMSADKVCHYEYTYTIAQLVGYPIVNG